MQIFQSRDITLDSIKITAPGDSPNTDGIHIADSTNIQVTNSVIGTGDDCISIGPGCTNLTIFNVICGPGHGISIGSLGKNANEKDVTGLTVRQCTLTGTSNGLRIKTWPSSPSSLKATGFVFEDIIMNNVYNPIIIDQNYCPYVNCPETVYLLTTATTTTTKYIIRVLKVFEFVHPPSLSSFRILLWLRSRTSNSETSRGPLPRQKL
ncbi:unnamed protein product [Musa hybrid cultivar]